MNFRRKLQAGLIKPFRSKAYRDYVASLECPCGNPADEAHHCIDVGLGGGMGTKPSDLMCIPVCRSCHTFIHQSVNGWQALYGEQLLWVYLTIEQAREDGVITL